MITGDCAAVALVGVGVVADIYVKTRSTILRTACVGSCQASNPNKAM